MQESWHTKTPGGKIVDKEDTQVQDRVNAPQLGGLAKEGLADHLMFSAAWLVSLATWVKLCRSLC